MEEIWPRRCLRHNADASSTRVTGPSTRGSTKARTASRVGEQSAVVWKLLLALRHVQLDHRCGVDEGVQRPSATRSASGVPRPARRPAVSTEARDGAALATGRGLQQAGPAQTLPEGFDIASHGGRIGGGSDNQRQVLVQRRVRPLGRLFGPLYQIVVGSAYLCHACMLAGMKASAVG